MKNGSLQDLSEKVSQGTTELDWLTRHRIALGVAAGLEFLHFNHHKKVIHRDLKPANVLLDDDMEARVVDFGGRHAHNKHQRGGDTGVHSPGVPFDMYSYGVPLAALVIGKLPSDKFFQKTLEIGMVKWLRKVKGGNGGEADGEWVRAADDAGAGSGLILLPGESQTETNSKDVSGVFG